MRRNSQAAQSPPGQAVYPVGMNLPVHIDVRQYSPRVRWFVAIAWALIVAKCTLLWWAMLHWSVPFHPLWIVGPTLLFALLATTLWLVHHED